MNNHIELIPGTNIDNTKWDTCVQQANNGLIYNSSNYLNAICPKWAGYVVNNYEAVIALPYRTKWNIPYWYTPPFMQQLGFIGSINKDTQKEILVQLLRKHPYGTLLFNFENTAIINLIDVKAKPNFILNLNLPYPEIQKGYSQDLQQDIRKAERNHFEYTNSIPIKKAIDLFKHFHAHHLKKVTEKDYLQFYSYCEQAIHDNQQCFTRAVLNEQKEILSIALLLRDNKRIYNLMNTTTTKGRAIASNHFLFNEIIKEFSEEPIWLDFEGSSLPGVQYFYKQFGTIEETYFTYHYNHLPFPLNLLQ